MAVRGINEIWKRNPWGFICIRNTVFLKPSGGYMSDHCISFYVTFYVSEIFYNIFKEFLERLTR